MEILNLKLLIFAYLVGFVHRQADFADEQVLHEAGFWTPHFFSGFTVAFMLKLLVSVEPAGPHSIIPLSGDDSKRFGTQTTIEKHVRSPNFDLHPFHNAHDRA